MIDAGMSGKRTYIVISILDQKRYALSLRALPTRIPLQLVLCSRDIIHQLPIREGPARQRVYDGSALRITILERVEEGQAGQRRCHPDEARMYETRAIDVVA